MVKRALLAATAILSTSLSVPALAGPPIPPEPTELDLYCAANAPQSLPNGFWFWNGVLGEIISTTDGDGTLLGFTMNPASRTIHALVEFNMASVTYSLQCNAMEPGAIVGQAPPNPNYSYATTYTDETGGEGTEIGRPAVCNPATTKKSGYPTSWYTVPGNSYLLAEAGKTCEQLSTDYLNGLLEPWF